MTFNNCFVINTILTEFSNTRRKHEEKKKKRKPKPFFLHYDEFDVSGAGDLRSISTMYYPDIVKFYKRKETS